MIWPPPGGTLNAMGIKRDTWPCEPTLFRTHPSGPVTAHCDHPVGPGSLRAHLGLSTSYALRCDGGKRLGWVVAPGLDLDSAAVALVIDEQLAWRPRVSPALSVRGGLELWTQSKRMH
jgi:hypothetical protein